MNRKIKLIVSTTILCCFVALLLAGCGCKHEWKEATCTEPRTCALCGETEGAALGHEWTNATCTSPRTCTRCGETEGEALGHDWKKATCTEPRTCDRCGETDGEALGHNWLDANCTNPKTCDRCGATEGEALGHEWIEATCTEPKTCTRCGAIDGEALGHDTPNLSCTKEDTCTRCGELISALGHDWKDATCTEPKTCQRCGITEGKALGHEAGDPKKENIHAATCTEDGYYDEVVYCSRCHTEMSRKTVTEKALGHTTTSGKCSRCGAEVYEPIKGKGADVVSGVQLGDGIYRARFVYQGSGNFIVHSYDADDDEEFLVNEIGNYDGFVLLLGKSPLTFEVKARGEWTINIERIPTTNAVSFSGKGDYVTDIASISSGTYEFTHDGNSNFIVHMITTDGMDYLVNEIGKYTGKIIVKIPSGSNALFEIKADGNWSIKKVG